MSMMLPPPGATTTEPEFLLPSGGRNTVRKGLSVAVLPFESGTLSSHSGISELTDNFSATGLSAAAKDKIERVKSRTRMRLAYALRYHQSTAGYEVQAQRSNRPLLSANRSVSSPTQFMSWTKRFDTGVPCSAARCCPPFNPPARPATTSGRSLLEWALPSLSAHP